MRHRRAFTLIELLVVVAIIAVLIAILVPALAGPKDAAIRAACAANLRGQGQMLAMYATSFNDRLPVITPGGDMSLQHLHDQTPTTANRLGFTDLLLASGAPAATTGAKIFQCPGSTPSATAFAAGILSYAYLNARSNTIDLAQAGNAGGLPNIPPTLRTSPQLSYHDRWTATPFASSTEIALDDIVSDNTANFSNPIPLATPMATAVYTNHMKSDTFPRGANVLYFDGHVKFQTLAGPPATGTPASAGQVFLTMNDTTRWYFPKP
jgi:prepilin-type N-terminal cleavage/methylation domain-containing protein/prepilin-type processing-associated H-X9-DG protein